MSTANKLTYLNTTKQKIKEGLNNLGADLTESDTFRSYANVLSDMYDALPKVTAEGTDLELSNTKKGKLVITPKGNCSQFSTTGKNLLPNNLTSDSANGITYTVYDDGSIICNGTATANTSLTLTRWSTTKKLNLTADSYKLSGTTTGAAETYRIMLYKSDYTYITECTNQTRTFTLSEDCTNMICTISIKEGTTVNNVLFKPMIRLSSITDDTYEPYTGGIPAPNPDYPYPVKTVTGGNSLAISNKNLLDWTQCTQNKAWNESGQLVNNSACWACNEHQPVKSSSITFSIDFTQSSGTQGRVYQFNGSGTLIVNTAITTFPTTITFNQNTAYYVYYFVNSMVPFESKLQIEKGSTATEYAGHRTQFPYSINLGKNLFNYNDLEDKIQTFTISGTANSFTINGIGTYQYPISITTEEIISGSWNSTNLNGDVKAIYEDDTNANILSSYSGSTASGNINFKPTKKVKAIQFRTYNTNNLTINNLQIEKGSTATSFAPYFTPIELCKVGDYQDYIYGNSNHWYKKQAVGKVVLNGSESWAYASVAQGSLFRVYDVGTGINNKIPLCNYFTGIMNATGRTNGKCYYNYAVNGFDFIFDNYDNLDDFKAWLSTHNTIVYYPLATPQDVQITDETLISQLNNIYNNAYSYNGTTNITSTYADGNAQMIIDASALKSWEVTE